MEMFRSSLVYFSFSFAYLCYLTVGQCDRTIGMILFRKGRHIVVFADVRDLELLWQDGIANFVWYCNVNFQSGQIAVAKFEFICN